MPADVEILVNAQFGYQVATQTVFEKGIVNIGEDGGPYVRSAGRWGAEITPGFIERFRSAYDAEMRRWVDAAKRGEIGGPALGMALKVAMLPLLATLRPLLS